MAWTEIENYRQLQQDYERAQTEYQRAEEAYLRAKSNEPESVVTERYAELATKRRDLEDLYDQLKQARSEVAHLREEASRKVLL